MKKIAVIGAGGFGQEVFCLWKESLQAQGIPFEFLGFFDDNPAIQHNDYGKVIGTIEDAFESDKPKSNKRESQLPEYNSSQRCLPG
jgi:hypothetical protein